MGSFNRKIMSDHSFIVDGEITASLLHTIKTRERLYITLYM